MIRKLFYVAIWLIGFLSLASCGPQYNHDMRLVRADSLMNEHPDSALLILENIDLLHLKNKANHAYYALLLTQARDKNFVVQTDDSLIQTAVRYYDGIKDNKMQAKAYYYWGSVYRDMNQCGEAIKKYLVAITYAKELEDKKLLGVLYNNIGYLYYTQNLDDKADSIYRQAEKLAIETKDSILLSEALYCQGEIDIQKGSVYYTQAEQKMLRALQIATIIKSNRTKAHITASLSSLYSLIKQAPKAISFAKQNISLQTDTFEYYRAYLLLGEAYFKATLYDSATIYLNKSIHSKSHSIKASVYMRLADIAKLQGNLMLSLEMERLHSAYRDSMNSSLQYSKILSAEKEIQLDQQQVYYKSYLKKHFYLFAIILICILLITCLLRKRYLKKNHQLRNKQLLLEQEKQTLHELYTQLKQQLTLKDKEIEKLHSEITMQQISTEKKHLLQAELDTLKQKREALAKEALEHSNVYAKIGRIISDFKEKDKSEEKMDKNDWQQLLVETDMRWNGCISELSTLYELSSNETHLICLLLTDYPFANFEYITNLSRRTLYRKKNEILKRIGSSQEDNIKEIIRKMHK